MDETHAGSGLLPKLTGPLGAVVDKHQDVLRSKLGSQLGSGAAAMLANDERVRDVARFCYPILPFPVRMVVKEDVFVDLVLRNRHVVLGRLVGGANG